MEIGCCLEIQLAIGFLSEMDDLGLKRMTFTRRRPSELRRWGKKRVFLKSCFEKSIEKENWNSDAHHLCTLLRRFFLIGFLACNLCEGEYTYCIQNSESCRHNFSANNSPKNVQTSADSMSLAKESGFIKLFFIKSDGFHSTIVLESFWIRLESSVLSVLIFQTLKMQHKRCIKNCSAAVHRRSGYPRKCSRTGYQHYRSKDEEKKLKSSIDLYSNPQQTKTRHKNVACYPSFVDVMRRHKMVTVQLSIR